MVKLVAIVKNDPKTKSTTYLADDGNTYVLKGDLAQRANNPGNISPTGKKAKTNYESSFGAIGYLPSSNGPPVAVFPDFESGNAAQVYLWQTPAYQNKTIEQAAKSWAASPYVDALVAAAGVPKDTLVKDLSGEQLNAIVSTQAGQEGAGKLSISDTNGNPVPLDLAVQLGAIRRPPENIGGAVNGMSGNAGAVAPPPLPRARPASPSLQVQMPRPRPDLVTPMPGRPASLSTSESTYTLPPPDLPLNPPMPPRPRTFWTNPNETEQPQMAGRSVAPRGLTIDQIGREADNARLNGYRQIQEMGPSSRGAVTTPPPAKTFGPVGPGPGSYATYTGLLNDMVGTQPPPVQRPTGALGGGMGAMGGGAAGVISPPTAPMPFTPSPLLQRGVVAPPAAPVAPPVAPASGGFNLGNALGGLGGALQSGINTLGTKAQEAGQMLGNTASHAVEDTRNAIGNTVQGTTDLLKSNLLGTVKGRTILFNGLLGLPPPGSHDPFKYGKTFAERQEFARRRQAITDGVPYVPATGVRTSVDIPRMPPAGGAPTPFQQRQAQEAKWAAAGLNSFGMLE